MHDRGRARACAYLVFPLSMIATNALPTTFVHNVHWADLAQAPRVMRRQSPLTLTLRRTYYLVKVFMLNDFVVSRSACSKSIIGGTLALAEQQLADGSLGDWETPNRRYHLVSTEFVLESRDGRGIGCGNQNETEGTQDRPRHGEPVGGFPAQQRGRRR